MSNVETHGAAMPLKTRPEVNLHDVDAVPPQEVATLRIRRHQIYPKGDLSLVDVVTRPEPGLVSRTTPIGTVGSCFASRLQDWLIDYGYNFVCTEPEPPSAEASVGGVGGGGGDQRVPAAPWRQTARFGVVWTTGCLRQSFEQALGEFEPDPRDLVWLDDELGEAKLHDPYRRGVWWTSMEERAADLERHARAVREAVERCEVFVVTPGMAEAWRSVGGAGSSGSGVYFHGVPTKRSFDPSRHKFGLTSVAENVRNLEGMYAAMRRMNPSIRLIVSLSPVPMMASFSDAHCIVSDTVSKSVLRVAVDEFCRNHREVIYFPSYEIVRVMAREPFESDNRHVKLDLVEKIMTTFMRAYGDVR